ncbi:MAG: capsule assembly Wzi family protein [Nitrospiria bacterium]
MYGNKLFTTPGALFCLTFLLLAPINSIAKEGGDSNTLRTEIGWIDLGAEKNRLRENHFGDRWKKRLNIQNALTSRTTMNPHVSFLLEPVSTHSREADDLVIRRGYVRIVDGNLALKAGRESLWWGPGRHGALLLSNNAFPFDLLQLESEKPFHLPGPLSRLGTFEVTSFLTELEANRDVSRPRLFGLRIGYHPFSWLSIGLSRITMHSGEGRPGFGLEDLVKVYFSDGNRGGKLEVNELAGVDFRIQIPLGSGSTDSRLEFYGEYGGEDEAGFRPSKPAILTGLEWTDKGRSLLIEYADNNIKSDGPVWYRHSVYTSGYTYRREIIGHHMGPDADDFFARVTTPLSKKLKIGIDFDQERHGLSTPTPEKLERYGGDLVYLFSAKLSYSFRYQYDRIKNLNRSPNPIKQTPSLQTGRNHYSVVSLTVNF